jgi:hypothetical protein
LDKQPATATPVVSSGMLFGLAPALGSLSHLFLKQQLTKNCRRSICTDFHRPCGKGVKNFFAEAVKKEKGAIVLISIQAG